jgi:LysR family hydrogen peroxide-inducible transcriptional activator
VPVNHPLAARKRISGADLIGKDMVLLDEGHCLSGQALDVCPAKQRENQNRLHAMSLETLRQMVAAGAGYSLIPKLAVGENPPLSDLISYKQLSGKAGYGRQIVMAWRKTYRRDADAHLLAQVIIDAVGMNIG